VEVLGAADRNSGAGKRLNIVRSKEVTMTVPSTFSGGCACEAVRYDCSTSPITMVNCHCRDCQRASGSAYSPTVVVPTATLVLVRGTPRYHEITVANGHVARRAFCGECGTPLFASSSAHPEMTGIRAGSLDDPSWYRAERDVWTGSAQPWDMLSPGTVKIR
jgi:hypothetical protein